MVGCEAGRPRNRTVPNRPVGGDIWWTSGQLDFLDGKGVDTSNFKLGPDPKVVCCNATTNIMLNTIISGTRGTETYAINPIMEKPRRVRRTKVQENYSFFE